MTNQDMIKLSVIQKILEEAIDQGVKGKLTIFYENGEIKGYQEMKDMFFKTI